MTVASVDNRYFCVYGGCLCNSILCFRWHMDSVVHIRRSSDRSGKEFSTAGSYQAEFDDYLTVLRSRYKRSREAKFRSDIGDSQWSDYRTFFVNISWICAVLGNVWSLVWTRCSFHFLQCELDYSVRVSRLTRVHWGGPYKRGRKYDKSERFIRFWGEGETKTVKLN